MTTRDRILNEALTLFADNGYDGTSVEEIAEKVGIKAPSLYNHFKGKEDILNALIDMAEARYEEFFGSDRHFGKLPENKEEFIQTSLQKISFTINDPMIRKMRKFLVREQFRNEQLNGIQGMYTKIIEGMMNEGLFKKDDPELLATEVTAPVALWIAKADRQPQCGQESMENIERHIRHFCDVYMLD